MSKYTDISIPRTGDLKCRSNKLSCIRTHTGEGETCACKETNYLRTCLQCASIQTSLDNVYAHIAADCAKEAIECRHLRRLLDGVGDGTFKLSVDSIDDRK